MDSTLDLLTLALLPGLAPLTAVELLGRGPLADALARPGAQVDLLAAPALEALRSGSARREAEAEVRRAEGLGIRVVGRDEPDYPAWLRRVYAPPLVLWTRGGLVAGEGERAVAVVGSRAATGLGLAFARALGRDLAEAGVAVVSGLARGIDGAAHRGALEGRGRTVAVLGSGLDRLYPPENRSLAQAIEADGAVVSEFPLGAPPWKANFPRRNRVIAGWARATVVVEAGARSGALSTARAALDEGRDVMAVPGHPSQPAAQGVNALLRDGAILVRGADDVLAEIGLARAAPGREEPVDEVLAALDRRAPAGVDEIQTRCRLALPALLARLSELEVQAAVVRLPGALFVRR
ncbi:MAG TPA: DNA-processing protein DprA [Vicinamibacteria bacterium]|nr:DNA-processing protein DprA [Vicinamibacteria bacterium]